MVLSLNIINLQAQTIQKGIVKEYNEKEQKTPLAGVELNVRSANNTVSDKAGNFTLEFLTMKPGEKVNVRNIQKAGYEVFNKQAVDQWALSPQTPFLIVMCRSDKFKRLCDTYYSQASASYRKQYEKETASLNKLKAGNKLKEEEYRNKLAEIQENYDRQLDNLDNYVDRFARIDLSELKAEEQEIINLVQEGRFEEAIERYEQLNVSESLISTIKNRDQKRDAARKLNESADQDQNDVSTMYETLNRQIETLMLTGGFDNNKKAAALLMNVADVDSTNVDILVKTGYHLEKYLADYAAALNYYDKALASALNQYGQDSLKEAICYDYIGGIYDGKGDYLKALEYYQKAYDIKEKILGKNDTEVAASLNNIAYIYQNQGDYQEALKYHQEALEIKESILGSDNTNVALSLNNIGSLYDVMGDYQKADEYYQRALEIEQSQGNGESLDVARILDNMGVLLYHQGDFQKASGYTQEALDIREKVLGKEHPLIANSLNNLGELYSKLGDYPKAIDCIQKAISIKEKIFGESPDLAISLNNLGNVYDDMEEYSKALDYHFRALDIKKNFLGPENPLLAGNYLNIGAVYSELGDYDKAIEYSDKSLKLYEKILGPDHPNMATLYNNIGYLLNKKGDYQKALEYYLSALDIYERKFGRDNKEVASSLENIGNLYFSQDDLVNTLDCFMQAYEIYEKLYGADSSKVKFSLSLVYSIFFQLCAKDVEYLPKLLDFMADKVFVATVAGEDTPAYKAGLSGEYYVLELEDWTFPMVIGLLEKSRELQGKPKTLVLLNEKGICQNHFENQIGVSFELKRVGTAEKQHIEETYNKWKSE